VTTLTEAAGRVIASDITDVFHSTDLALLSNARLVASVLEGTTKSGMHPRTKQKLLEAMSLGYGKILEGRKAMVQAHSQMVVIQQQSNLATIGYGCWGRPTGLLEEGEPERTASGSGEQQGLDVSGLDAAGSTSS
jgi:hypothetical protein